MDTTEVCEKTSKMWGDLGDQIAAVIPTLVEGGAPMKAMHYATCAEACYWKSTGDADTHDVKDVLPSAFLASVWR